ncbi:hypothetical protein P389DRAFT_160282 [Cystobasidium minutum MCA 4210]|uniref:uncharacterized protein n=1 Tax=Cystobasidium minutum MCA 4210 TaxID=1397322 RepID=UPI0034CFD282|eukprot:jgi/Rhomi1/160282/estExt_Genewise1Plus.C_4_t10170
MSRPSSRVSSVSRVPDQQQQQYARLGTESAGGSTRGERRSVSSSSSNATIQASRPHSSLSAGSAYTHVASASAARVPFTPGATNKTSKIANIGLSAKQVDKLSETIAEVRRGPSLARRDNDSSSQRQSIKPGNAAPLVAIGNHANSHDRKGKGRASAIPEASFIAETSFVDAPLNSRLVNNTTAAARQERLTNKRLRQLITKTEDDTDNETDLQQLDDEVPPEVEDDASERDDITQADLEIQEALLVEDLLSVLIGIDGQFIRQDVTTTLDPTAGDFSGSKYVIDEAIDPSLRDLTYKILKLATYHDSIQSFVEAYSHLNFGLTSHALCSGIREYVKEYDLLISRLEEHFDYSPVFSLQRFYFLVQPALHQLFLIYELIQDLTTSPAEADASAEEESGDLFDDDSDDDDRFGGGKAMKEALKQMSGGGNRDQGKSPGWSAGGPVKGGEMLAIIDERLQRTSGDPEAFKLYSTLLLKSSQPYAETLLSWITTGHLTDPYDEFMIREHKSLHREALEQDYVDEYWDRKYTLKDKSLSNSTSGMASGLDADKQLLSSTTGSYSQDAISRESRATKREKGLGGGAIIPAFLENLKIKVLLAGKYLNVIRESGSGDLLEEMRQEAVASGDALKANMKIADGDVDMTSESFQAQLDAAYYTANKACLKLLIERQALFARLGSLKHHFFLDHGDSFTHFLDSATHELSKRAKNVSVSKLQSLLDLAIRNPSSASSADPYKEDVRITLSSTSLPEWLMKINSVDSNLPNEEEAGGDHAPDSASAAGDGGKDRKKEDKHPLTGIEALSLDYTVDFPLSLVLSRKCILRYQLIFRHLLALKHLEQALTSSWLEHTKNPIWRKRTPHIGLEKWKNRVFTLRSRMLAFIQQMFAFAVSEVLETNWRILMKRLESVATVDQLLDCHNDFLSTCCKQCMLTNSKLQKVQSKLMTTCAYFLSYNARFTKAVSALSDAVEHAVDNGEDCSLISIESQNDTLSKFEVNFYRHQKLHADTVTFHAMSDTGSLLALVVRLSNTMPESDGLA